MPAKNLFQLCRRKFLKPDEKQLFIDNPDKVNKEGENLLHHYIKCSRRLDLKLIQDMIDNGHDINNLDKSERSMFHTCVVVNKAQYEVLNLLVDNHCPLVTPNVDLTRFMLYDQLGTYYNQIIDEEYFKLIQRLVGLNLLETDLKNKYPNINPLYYAKDYDMFVWLDKTFDTLYDIEDSKYMYHPLLHYYAYRRDDTQIFEYICQKDSSTVNLVTQTNPTTPLMLALIHNNYQLLEILYKYGVDDIKIIDKYIKFLLTQGVGRCNNKNYIAHTGINGNYMEKGYDQKRNFIWLIINKKLKEFPIRLIKVFRITLEDFDNFPNISRFNHGILTKSHYYEYYFEEDCTEINTEKLDDLYFQESLRPKYIKTMKELNKKFDLEDYTKDYCQDLYDEIMKLII